MKDKYMEKDRTWHTCKYVYMPIDFRAWEF